MQKRVVCAALAIFVLGWMKPVSTVASRCTDQNTPLEIVFSDASGDRIRSDGQTYSAAMNVCSGTLDATMSLLASKTRWVNFLFDQLLNGHTQTWMTGWQALPTFINISHLGFIRDTSAGPQTTRSGWTFKDATNRSYSLYFLSNGTDTDIHQPFYQGPSDVNMPLITSPVSVVFTPGIPSDPGNPFGQWNVSGRLAVGAQTETQVGTVYRSEKNMLVRVGQFSLPFALTVRALAPLPPQ